MDIPLKNYMTCSWIKPGINSFFDVDDIQVLLLNEAIKFEGTKIVREVEVNGGISLSDENIVLFSQVLGR